MKNLVLLLQHSSLDVADILNQVSDAIIFVDLEHRIQGWNKSAEQLFGYSASEVIGTYIRNIIPLSKTITEKQKIQKTLDKHGHWEGEVPCKTKNGIHLTVLCTISVVKDGSGKALGQIQIVKDITERKRAEKIAKFKIDSGKILSSSLDYRKTLQNVAKIVVPQLADWCAVDFMVKDKFEPMVFLHKNPRRILQARKIREKYPTPLAGSEGIAKVVKIERSVFYPKITQELFAVLTHNSEHRELLSDLGFSSLIIVPLKIGKSVIGGILLARDQNSPSFDQRDFEMAQDLAVRSSFAIENARLYRLVEKERARLDRLVADVPGVVWEAWGNPDDPTQQINFVSKYVEKMLGYSVDDWLSIPNFWLSIVLEEDRARAAAEAKSKFDSKKPGISRFRWVRKDGKIIWVEAQSTPILDKNNKPIGMRGVTMDITERMDLENKKNEFISAASHELKTPLTTQKAFVQLLIKLAREERNSKYLSYLQKVEYQTDRLAHLINDLLDISKIEAGKLVFNKQKMDLADCIRETIEDFQHISNKHQMLISGSFDSYFYGDRERLSQVIINLLSNAAKYSPEKKTIRIKLEETADSFRIAVTDYGIGISRKNQERVFDRFYREEAGTRNFPGLGMGLYISDEIVRAHGGEITIRSRINHGSTFTVRLPKKI